MGSTSWKEEGWSTEGESSYDDEDSKEARLTRIVEKCHNQATSFLLDLISL